MNFQAHMQEHIKAHHDQSHPSSYDCEWCSTSFTGDARGRKQLSAHRSHCSSRSDRVLRRRVESPAAVRALQMHMEHAQDNQDPSLEQPDIDESDEPSFRYVYSCA